MVFYGCIIQSQILVTIAVFATAVWNFRKTIYNIKKANRNCIFLSFLKHCWYKSLLEWYGVKIPLFLTSPFHQGYE